MSLDARLTRMEARQGYSNPPVTIVADSQDDFSRRFEEALLASRPGLLSVSGTIGGEPFREDIDLLPHEKTLELLS